MDTGDIVPAQCSSLNSSQLLTNTFVLHSAMGTIEVITGNIGNIVLVQCQFSVSTWSLLDVESTTVDGGSPRLDLKSQISI